MPVGKQNPKWQRTVLLATDNNHSVIGEIADGKTNLIGYSAYGEQSSKQEVSTQLAFTGQPRESNIGWYLLGNGYRAYNPRLMRFHSPDSWSPFGRGGLNAYMYCAGDPVNRSDPNGHVPLFPGLPLGLRKTVSRTVDFFFGGSGVTGPNRSQAIKATERVEAVAGAMRPEKTGELKSLIGAGSIVAGTPGPRGNNSPAIQYVETTKKYHPGFVEGAARDGLTNYSYSTPRASSSSGGSLSNSGRARQDSFYAPRTLYEGSAPREPVLVHERLLGGSPHSGPPQPPPPPLLNQAALDNWSSSSSSSASSSRSSSPVPFVAFVDRNTGQSHNAFIRKS